MSSCEYSSAGIVYSTESVVWTDEQVAIKSPNGEEVIPQTFVVALPASLYFKLKSFSHLIKRLCQSMPILWLSRVRGKGKFVAFAVDVPR